MLVWIMLYLAVMVAPHASADDAAIREEIASKLVGVEAHELTATAIPGLYEIARGPTVLYVSADGRYLVRGSIIDLTTHENLTDARRAEARAAWSAGLDESTMVIFTPERAVTHTITVFTDIDCSYCRRLHSEINDLMTRGVRVRYLFYPRSGLGTESAAKADAVWCSPDRNDAMTRAKAGEEVVARACGTTPVAAHMALASDIGVDGTPTIITDSGDLIPGYLPAPRLLAELTRMRVAREGQRSR